MSVIAISEPIGREWRREVLRVPVGDAVPAAGRRLLVVDRATGEPIPAQWVRPAADRPEAWVYVERLAAGQRLRRVHWRVHWGRTTATDSTAKC